MLTIQQRHFELRNRAMDALMALIADLKDAVAAGRGDAQLARARDFQRAAQFYLDFVDFSRQGQVAVRDLGGAAAPRSPSERPR